MINYSLSLHDSHPSGDCAVIDSGIEKANENAAPLHEVKLISCIARSSSNSILGGAVGRWWGECCELQQLWVVDSHRRQGIGTQLLIAFEEHARSKGCNCFYLETFSFQAPNLYKSQGYQIEFERRGYPHGIIKYHMTKRTN